MKPAHHYDRPPQRHVPGEIAPHGTPTRYVQHKCRCQPCRDAFVALSNQARRRRAYGQRSDWEEFLVDATEAREHVLMLAKQGFGAKFVEQVSGIGHTALWEIRSGRRERIFPGTRDRILGVTLSDLRALKPTATVPAKDTLRLIDEMIAAGFAKSWIANQIGKPSGLQIGTTGRVFVGSAQAVKELHDRLWRENAEGFKRSRFGVHYSGRRMREVCKCGYATETQRQLRAARKQGAAA